jgi:hypothetical protein
MAFAERGEEGFGEHAVYFRGCDGTGVFAGSLEGVMCWVEVAMLDSEIAGCFSCCGGIGS